MEILDGKKVARIIKDGIQKEIALLEKKPVLAIILVGSDPASKIYVAKKREACEEMGVESIEINLPGNILEVNLQKEVEKLNQDINIDAIMVQIPLPKHISTKNILDAIAIGKDVECLNSCNFGKFSEYGKNSVAVSPVTAMAVMKILEVYKIEIEGKNAVVVGNSNIIGKPIAMLLTDYGATVTVCHNKTKDLGIYTRNADILVVAVGKKQLIGKGMFKKGAVVIDVGINREGNKLFGDVDLAAAKKLVGAITPVPGGVGPVTVAMLMKNTFELYLKNYKI